MVRDAFPSEAVDASGVELEEAEGVAELELEALASGLDAAVDCAIEAECTKPRQINASTSPR
jgi:hypothetical protein